MHARTPQHIGTANGIVMQASQVGQFLGPMALAWMATTFAGDKGRWVGHINYDFGRLFEPTWAASAAAPDTLGLPLFHFTYCTPSGERRTYAPELVSAALGQARLRQRAAAKFGAHAIGIEFDAEMIATSRKRADEQGVADDTAAVTTAAPSRIGSPRPSAR